MGEKDKFKTQQKHKELQRNVIRIKKMKAECIKIHSSSQRRSSRSSQYYNSYNGYKKFVKSDMFAKECMLFLICISCCKEITSSKRVYVLTTKGVFLMRNITKSNSYTSY